jgi:uncharacterized protein
VQADGIVPILPTASGEALYKRAMSFDLKLLDIIACPKCRGRLESRPDGSALLCRACRLAYPIVDDIPDLIAEDAQSLG